MNNALIQVGVVAGVSLAFGYMIGLHGRRQGKFLSIRRVGDKQGRPIVCFSWADVLNVYPGKHPRVFLPNGDEISEVDRTQALFDALPNQQLLYVAPNAEDFNPIEVIEYLDEQQMKSQTDLYHRFVSICLEKLIPPHPAVEGEDSAAIQDYVKASVDTYQKIQQQASQLLL